MSLSDVSATASVARWIAVASRDGQYASRLRGRLPMDNLSNRFSFLFCRLIPATIGREASGGQREGVGSR
ncbi:MAG: hypothetical protein LBQ54_13795 [Planctomycetaceae bacterium]|nr:hypothetical protein [Planctomycetaceae bacterium]